MTQTLRAHRAVRPGFARLAALVLAALILCAAMASPSAQAAEWMTPYLEQVKEWGVMRGDSSGNLHEDRNITRAEFVTLVNRAFGYNEVGPHTFTDVRPNDWYAEDISIAHQAGYFQGTSPTTASPLSLVTREQAAVLLGRCLRFQGVTGAANSTFTDMQDIGGWSRGLVQEAAELGIIQGYSDGTFRPDQPITRGQMACFLVRALGTLIQEKGEQSSGGVYGNLTITVPGVKLKDTTITGNLYLTGGVGLGNVELENVTVLGKIVVCGSGEAERGDHSIVLRNVTAAEMDIDSLAGQFLSVQAEGLTDIGTTTVRTSAFIQDLTEDGIGLRRIRLDGEEGAKLQLAGNIKDVTNLTPASALEIAQGVAKMVTIDERAIDSTLAIDEKSSIVELNLDRGIPVTGPGSISHLNVNAEGATVEMLPDTLTVRPGIIANINKLNMNNITAAESSEDPRILAGYPLARNVAATSAEVVYRTNKTGTIYWGLTALMDGSLGEEELMNPSNYSAKIIRSGTIKVTASNTDVVGRLTALTKEGSYYVSALLEDARGRRSPVKVAAFTTPDDTAPNFATGYPQTPILTTDADGEQIAQIMVMPTKDCQMYYVLLPKGSTAPTAADFRSAALPGNLGYGIVTLRKNTPFLVSRINSSHLQEQTDYDLYLWLNDADNGKSSSVKKITFKTKDLTPPTITKMEVKTIGARTVTMTFALDEPGTLYWAVVRQGASFYAAGIDKDNPNEIGKIQIENGSGSNVVRRGGPIRAAKGATDYSFNITGLESQTAYDLYYVAKDTAGNYCVYMQSLTPPMEINTLDNEPPTVTQEFTNDGDGPVSHPTPYPDSTVRLVFSEVVLGARNEGGEWQYDSFEDAYRDAQSGDAAKQKVFADLLRSHIKLYRKPATGRDELLSGSQYERTADNESTIGDSWVIDYRYATVSRDPSGSGEMIIAFPYGSGINLGSGETYYFVVSNIADNSDAHNRMKNSAGNREGYKLPEFTTVDAQLLLSAGSATGTINGQTTMFDMNFRITPEGTNNVSSDVLWDLIFWADESLEFELYCNDGSGWQQVGNHPISITTNAQQARTGVSYTKQLLSQPGEVPNFEQLNQVTGVRDYGIMITKRGDNDVRETWTGDVTLTILPVAGDLSSLTNLADKNLTPSVYTAHQSSNYAVREIGVPREYQVSKPFTDTAQPTFIEGYPRFTPTDSGVSINIMVSRDNCKYFCIVTKVGNIPTILSDSSANNGTNITDANWTLLPQTGLEIRGATGGLDPTGPGNVNPPSTTSITSGTTYVGPSYIIRNGSCGRRVTNISVTTNDTEGGLDANSQYVAYFVLQGDDPSSASKVYAFRFQTEVVTRPVLTVTLNSPTGIIQADREADVWYALVTAGTTQPPFSLNLPSFCTVGVNGWTAALATRYANTSVLEAMRMEAPSGLRGSLFDAYADLDHSNTIEIINIVKSSGSSGGSIPIAAGPISLTNRNNLMTSQNFSRYLVGSAEYWLVAVGQCQGTSGHAFRSNRYLRNTDQTPPQVTALASTVQHGTIYAVADKPKAVQERYSGEITINFSEALYYRVSSEVRKQIVDAPLIPNLPSDKYASSASLLGNSKFTISYKYSSSITESDVLDCMSLTIKYTNCIQGDTITFDSNLCDVNNNPGTIPLSFTLNLVEENGYLYPRFQFANTAVSNQWNATIR